MTSPHWAAKTAREGREKLCRTLRDELLGPSEESEVLHESPLTRYVIGMLSPFGTPLGDSDYEEESIGEGKYDVSSDATHPVSQALTPSSIGLSVLVPNDVSELLVTARWGDYDREEVEGNDPAPTASDPAVEDEEQSPKRIRRKFRWLRTQRHSAGIRIKLEPSKGLRQQPARGGDSVFIEHITRTVAGGRAVSIFLVNRRITRHGERPPVDRWIFQPEVAVCSRDGSDVFLPRGLEPALAATDQDLETNRLLFRHRKEYGIGHACAVEWTESKGRDHASRIATQLIPTFELPRTAPRALEMQGLQMEALAGVEDGRALQKLIWPLIDNYANWIGKQRKEVATLPPDLREIADSHLKECESTLARLGVGVEAIGSNDRALKAFRFANRAMLLQRSHSVWSKQRKNDPHNAPNEPRHEGRWHPFQLAFILTNLPGLIDPLSKDRSFGDLLWFPTGGGKTEAYLGLTAFTLAYRRLTEIPGYRTDAGVSVLMRYSLRLLTIQQFQRAATLLSACEVIRRAQPEVWGQYRFSLGLWLGRKGTPNSFDDAKSALLRLQNDPDEEGPNPCVLESCPWCGESLTPWTYGTDGERRRTRVWCPRPSCEFAKHKDLEGIPVVVVDEEVYLECPSLVIATVDKFAQMPWNGNIQALFGHVNQECEGCGFLTAASEHNDGTHAGGRTRQRFDVSETERLAPPDLIIQDELHLISGPLGTLVGLYETAIDFLCARNVGAEIVRPKVIASTATIRRAYDQIQAIFDRELRVFPPPALTPEDSFFALEEEPSNEAPGRLYVGVCAPGKSMKTVYVRTAASLMSSVSGLHSASTVAEGYQTLVSYFNSIRELGGAVRLMDDDIPARLRQLERLGQPFRRPPVYRELTSRIRQEEIPELLRRLETRHDAQRRDGDPRPLDVALATNMISVGVDIDRLGLMTVTGQPKTSAEYIQATSRVGRAAWAPGLVITLYNWSRPRDLSHYERFRHYHSTFYRNVEAVSVTPFSPRALDRGIRAVFVAMARLGHTLLAPETAARYFDPTLPHVTLLIQSFRRRVGQIAGEEAANSITQWLKGVADEWWRLRAKPLRYGWRVIDQNLQPPQDPLLRAPEGGRFGHWPTPQSLREVEELSSVRVLSLAKK